MEWPWVLHSGRLRQESTQPGQCWAALAAVSFGCKPAGLAVCLQWPGDSRALLAPHLPSSQDRGFLHLLDPPSSTPKQVACSYLCSTEIPEGAVGRGCAKTCICTPETGLRREACWPSSALRFLPLLKQEWNKAHSPGRAGRKPSPARPASSPQAA